MKQHISLLLCVMAFLVALPGSLRAEETPDTADAPLCQVGPKTINPAVMMHLKDMGDRVLRALYEKQAIPLLAMAGYKEDDTAAKKAMEVIAQNFWPQKLDFGTGSPVYTAWIPRVDSSGENDEPAVRCAAHNLFNSETCTLYPSKDLTGKAFGVIGYRFGNDALTVAVFVYVSFENGALKLVDVSRHDVMRQGRSAATYSAAAMQARSFNDSLVASVLFRHAATLIPNGPRILFSHAQTLVQQAATGDKIPASEDTPLQFHCPGLDVNVWRYDLFFHGSDDFLRITYEAPSLDEKTVAPYTTCVETILTQTHPLAGELFDAFLLEARVLPPSQPGEYRRKTLRLTKRQKPGGKKANSGK